MRKDARRIVVGEEIRPIRHSAYRRKVTLNGEGKYLKVVSKCRADVCTTDITFTASYHKGKGRLLRAFEQQQKRASNRLLTGGRSDDGKNLLSRESGAEEYLVRVMSVKSKSLLQHYSKIDLSLYFTVGYIHRSVGLAGVNQSRVLQKPGKRDSKRIAGPVHG